MCWEVDIFFGEYKSEKCPLSYVKRVILSLNPPGCKLRDVGKNVYLCY